MKSEFQRRARRDKKAFLSDQCKEIEENSRMRKTRDLFKKIRDTKGKINLGTRDDKNAQKNYKKKYLNDPDNHNVVITHL